MGDKQQFIGQREIDKFSKSEVADLVGVLYKDGTNEDFTKEQFDNVVSDEKYDAGLVATKKFEKMLQRIIKDMAESRVNLDEQAWVLEKLSTVIAEKYTESIAKLYNVSRTGKIMLADVDQVLKS